MKKNAVPRNEWYGGFAPVIIILVIAILGVVGYFVYKYYYSQQTKVINNNPNSVIKITESVWNGPTKAEPDKIWEVEAKSGIQTTDSNSSWTMEIVSVTAGKATVKFAGKIYKDLVQVNAPLELTEGKKETLDTGTAGGGASWDFLLTQSSVLVTSSSPIPQQSTKDEILKNLAIYCKTKGECQFDVAVVKDASDLAWGTWRLTSGQSTSSDGWWATTKTASGFINTELKPGKDYKPPDCSTPVNNPASLNEEITYCLDGTGDVVLRP